MSDDPAPAGPDEPTSDAGPADSGPATPPVEPAEEPMVPMISVLGCKRCRRERGAALTGRLLPQPGTRAWEGRCPHGGVDTTVWAEGYGPQAHRQAAEERRAAGLPLVLPPPRPIEPPV